MDCSYAQEASIIDSTLGVNGMADLVASGGISAIHRVTTLVEAILSCPTCSCARAFVAGPTPIRRHVRSPPTANRRGAGALL